MKSTPTGIESTRLWEKLADRLDLASAITSLRRNVESLAANIKEILPSFTDHSIRHFDHLWRVADLVITEAEYERMTPGEAFLLGGAIYLHDLGMAYGATLTGKQRLMQTAEYSAAFERFTELGVPDPEREALREVSRLLHAKQAQEIAINKIPELDRHLIESKEIRDVWGATIGEIAASHHWSISQLREKLGQRGQQPIGDLQVGDLCYVAAMLRIIDYSDISRERARPFERPMRDPLPSLSKAHWDAQQNIAGPIREEGYLVYSSMSPIASVEGWWTFYEMATGLDAEILEVGELLQGRPASVDRFSLRGVRAIRTPQSFAGVVATAGFEPVDVRFRPDSISRIVTLLGGESLYGKDPYAPIRELLQNAVDAYSLYRAWAESEGASVEPPAISIKIGEDDVGRWLEVTDNGIGMSELVITKYLLSIGSSYWKSDDFFREFSKVDRRGLRQVGKFGIGFLSVFMLGDEIEVVTQRRFKSGFRLRINGAGQRGAIEKMPAHAKAGTTVRIRLKPDALVDANLAKFMRERAPLIRIPVTVSNGKSTTVVQPGWWKELSQENYIRAMERDVVQRKYRYIDRSTDRIFPGDSQPEYVEDNVRIIASPKHSTLVVCSKGFTITQLHLPGFLGFVDLDSAEINAARDELISPTPEELRTAWIEKLERQIIAAIDLLDKEGNIPAIYGFIALLIRYYGQSPLLTSNLRWLASLDFGGSCRLLTAEEARHELKDAKRIFIAYGSPPWLAAKNAEIIFGTKLNPADKLFVLSSEQQAAAGPHDNRTVVGSFESHFSREYGEPRKPEILSLFLELTGSAVASSDMESYFKWARWNGQLFGMYDASKLMDEAMRPTGQ